MAAGKDVVGKSDGAAHILCISRERYAPDAIDSIFQDLALFALLRRTDRTMGAFLMESDMARQKAVARIVLGSGFPDGCVPALCMQNASLPKNEKTLASASVRSTLAFPELPAQTR